MLKIQVQKAAKRFHYEWIFKNLDLELSSGDSLAITGGNGSGKSTLLKCLSGATPLTQGSIAYQTEEGLLAEDVWFRSLTIAAPYMELPEEFTLLEAIDFHFKFKQRLGHSSTQELVALLGLEKHQQKALAQFSSGMKQRVKLGLAIFSEAPLLLLDEPTSNLDKQGIAWYLDTIERYAKDRITIVCSNEIREYAFCQNKITLEDYK